MEEAERTAVYDIWYKGALIYVGVANKPKHRFTVHRTHKTFPAISEMKVYQWFSTREEALKAEADRIKELKPAYNIRMRVPDREIRGKKLAAERRKAVVQIDWEDEAERWKKMLGEIK